MCMWHVHVHVHVAHVACGMWHVACGMCMRMCMWHVHVHVTCTCACGMCMCMWHVACGMCMCMWHVDMHATRAARLGGGQPELCLPRRDLLGGADRDVDEIDAGVHQRRLHALLDGPHLSRGGYAASRARDMRVRVRVRARVRVRVRRLA